MLLTLIMLVQQQCLNAQLQKAPAYPLITHTPYFSVWSFTDTLNEALQGIGRGAAQPLVDIKSRWQSRTALWAKWIRARSYFAHRLMKPTTSVKYTENQPEWMGRTVALAMHRGR